MHVVDKALYCDKTFLGHRLVLGLGYRLVLGLGYRLVLGLGYRLVLGLGYWLRLGLGYSVLVRVCRNIGVNRMRKPSKRYVRIVEN